MKTTLIALPILGFLSTPTVATFLVGTWYLSPVGSDLQKLEDRKVIANGTFISTGTNQSNVLNA
jgi:hypothetical protein